MLSIAPTLVQLYGHNLQSHSDYRLSGAQFGFNAIFWVFLVFFFLLSSNRFEQKDPHFPLPWSLPPLYTHIHTHTNKDFLTKLHRLLSPLFDQPSTPPCLLSLACPLVQSSQRILRSQFRKNPSLLIPHQFLPLPSLKSESLACLQQESYQDNLAKISLPMMSPHSNFIH